MIKDKVRLEVHMEQKMCDDCKRDNLDYYQLKTQIRFKFYTEEQIEKICKKIIDLLSKDININNFVFINDSLDIFVKYHSQIDKVSSIIKSSYISIEKRTKKLTGRDNLKSKDMYRYFISFIVINLRRGDKISYQGEVYKIYSTEKDTLLIQDTQTGKKRKILLSKNIDLIEKV